MKTQLIIYPAMFVTLFVACGEKKGNIEEESVEAQNEMSGELHEDDTTFVTRDGTLLEGTISLLDSIHLPAPVIEAIDADASLSTEKIISTREYIENNRNYYEVKFEVENEETKTLVFDEKGKIKTED